MHNVRQFGTAAVFAATMLSLATVASAQDKPAKATAPSSAGKSLTWGPAPDVFPAGAKMAVERGEARRVRGSALVPRGLQDSSTLAPDRRARSDPER
jgi:hypothetical protein